MIQKNKPRHFFSRIPFFVVLMLLMVVLAFCFVQVSSVFAGLMAAG